MKVILLTGGCGFIGSAVVRHLIRHTEHTVINLDKLTYAGSTDALEEAWESPRHRFIRADIADPEHVDWVCAGYQPDAIMHLAAESHVDRSIAAPGEFVRTNLMGTFVMLEAARAYYSILRGAKRDSFVFHHISTDEVFGSLGPSDPPFFEGSHYEPRNPYSASKAGSDHLVRAWANTYGLPTIVTNSCNNYGPWQFPEKLIPLTINNLLQRKPIYLHGEGQHIRDWIYVEDHAEALVQVLERGRPGDTYGISAREPRTNTEVVMDIWHALWKLDPGLSDELIQFQRDRPGNDLRYETDPSRIELDIGWRPKHDFETGLAKTIQWHCAHRAWLHRHFDSQEA